MTRETKVGLIFGLGVILLVGVFISDYLNDLDGLRDESVAENFANFSESTTNQPALNLPAPSDTTLQNSREIAAAAVEDIQRRQGVPPVPQPVVNQVQPPPRQFGPGVGSSDIAPLSTIQPAPVVPPQPLDRVAMVEPEPVVLPEPRYPEINPRRVPDTTEVNMLREPQPQGPTRVEHTVKDGETLTAIARRYYEGDENMWRSIRDANPGKVGPNGEVNANVTLTIPVRSAEVQVATTEGQDLPRRIGDNTPAANRSRMLVVTVKEGDTLSGIAAKYLGSAQKWRELLDTNAGVLTKPEELRVGMRLRIPSVETEQILHEANEALAAAEPQPTPQPAPRQEPAPQADGRTYTVKSGDSLYRIAVRTLGDGNRYKEIYEANRDKLRSADDIRVGMVLKLPQASVASAE